MSLYVEEQKFFILYGLFEKDCLKLFANVETDGFGCFCKASISHRELFIALVLAGSFSSLLNGSFFMLLVLEMMYQTIGFITEDRCSNREITEHYDTCDALDHG